jgi:glycosyltransferase involved in cell wall biosynthesis
MVQMLVDSSLGRDFEIRVANTSKGVLRWAVEKQDWRSPLLFVRNLFRVVSALIRVRPRVAYVHAAPSISFTRDWVHMAAARLLGARVVCHYHGTLHTRFPSPRTRFGRWVGRTLMAAANRIIVLGPTYQREMGRAWGRSDVTWSPNLVEAERFEAARAGATAPWLSPGERGVLYGGRLSAPKGFFDLLDAAPAVLARHPEARFVLCGVAETDAGEPRLRAEVERRGLASRVSFLGSLEGAELARAYVTSTVFVSPTWTEAFPLVIPEAMAAGLPMVVTAVGAIPDFVHDGEDGFLVPPHDAASLADRVVRLLDDEPLRRRIAEHVRSRAAREFAVEVGAERVRRVLRELVAA